MTGSRSISTDTSRTAAAAAIAVAAALAVLTVPVPARSLAAAPLYLASGAVLLVANHRSPIPRSPWGPGAVASIAMALFPAAWEHGTNPTGGRVTTATGVALACLLLAVTSGTVAVWRGARPWLSHLPTRRHLRVAGLAVVVAFIGLGVLGLASQGPSSIVPQATLVVCAVLVAVTLPILLAARSEVRRLDRTVDWWVGMAFVLHVGLTAAWWYRGEPAGDPVSGWAVYATAAVLTTRRQSRAAGAPVDHRPLVTSPSSVPVVATAVVASATTVALVVGADRWITVSGAVATVIATVHSARAFAAAPGAPAVALTRADRLRRDLARALVSHEVRLRYEPVVRLDDDALAGLDALAVWHHPTLGTVDDGELRATARRAGLAAELDLRLIDRAIPDARAVTALAPIDEPWLSIGIDPTTVDDPRFVTRVTALAAAWGSSLDGLALRLSSPVRPEHAPALRQLQDCGAWVLVPAPTERPTAPDEVDADLVTLDASRVPPADVGRSVRTARSAGHRVEVCSVHDGPTLSAVRHAGAHFARGSAIGACGTMAELLAPAEATDPGDNVAAAPAPTPTRAGPGAV